MNDKNDLEPDPLREAAWYALIPYINPIDCSKKMVLTTRSGTRYACPIPLNTNAQLESFYMGKQTNGKSVKPFWFSKKLLAAHLQGIQTFYYRSRPNGVARTGYGSSDDAWKRLGAAADVLGIRGRCRKSRAVGVMLVCADIDAHCGEKDVAAVRDWLLRQYFPNAYWEPSTNGRGVHLYLKISYFPYALKDQDRTLRHVVGVVNQLACLLDEERRKLGFDAPVDKLRGLPTLFAWTESGLSIQRGGCIKVPRFASGLSDVVRFHESPSFEFSELKQLFLQSQSNDVGLPTDREKTGLNEINPEEEQKQGFAYRWDIDDRSLPKPPICAAGLLLNSAYPSYELEMSRLKNQAAAFTRTHSFALTFSRRLGRIPSVNEALAEDEKHELHTGDDRNGERAARIEYVLTHVAKTFNAQAGLAGFEQHRKTLTAEITGLLGDRPLPTYRKTKGRPAASATVDEIAMVLFAMRRSQGRDVSTEYGYAKVQDALKRIRGKKCSRDRASCILKSLTLLGLIQKVAGGIPGKRGAIYRVRSSDPQVAAT